MPAPSPQSAARRALVNGAGGGLGRAVAEQLAARGCSVAVLDINAAGGEATAAFCRKSGWEALAIADDRTRDGAPEAAVDAVIGRWGRLDVLVNNAGFGGIE